MAKQCILCGKTYKYCKSCRSDAKKGPWSSLFDTENCKNNSKALTDYNLKKITKEDARDALSQCDLSIELKEFYRNEIEEIMAKPKRSFRPQPVVVDEVVPELTYTPEVVESKEELIEVVITE